MSRLIDMLMKRLVEYLPDSLPYPPAYSPTCPTHPLGLSSALFYTRVSGICMRMQEEARAEEENREHAN